MLFLYSTFSGIHSVPVEILNKILANLGLLDRVRSRLVCHQWKLLPSQQVVSVALLFSKSATDDCEVSVKLETEMGQRATVQMKGQQRMERGLGGLFQFSSHSLYQFAYQMVRGYASQCPEVMDCQLSVARLAVQHLTALESVVVVGRNPNAKDKSLQQLYALLLGPQLSGEATRTLSLPENIDYTPLPDSSVSSFSSAIQPSVLRELHLSINSNYIDNRLLERMPFSVENTLLKRLGPQLQRLHLICRKLDVGYRFNYVDKTYEWVTFPHLQQLRLSHVGIVQRGGCCPLLSLAQWAPQLQSVSISPAVFMFDSSGGPVSYSQLADFCPRLSHLDIDGEVGGYNSAGAIEKEWFSWPSEFPLLRIMRPYLLVDRMSMHPSTLIEGNVEVLEGEEEKRVERERVKSSWALWDMQIT